MRGGCRGAVAGAAAELAVRVHRGGRRTAASGKEGETSRGGGRWAGRGGCSGGGCRRRQGQPEYPPEVKGWRHRRVEDTEKTELAAGFGY